MTRLALVVLCGIAGGLAAPGPVEAQSCAQCKSCKDCDRSDWGADSCDFKGKSKDGKGCCQMTGNVCNPTLSLNVANTDLRIVPADEEQTLVARLEDNVFGTWTCGEGELRVAYREVADGMWVEIEGPELSVYRDRYPLVRYVELVQQGLRDGPRMSTS